VGVGAGATAGGVNTGEADEGELLEAGACTGAGAGGSVGAAPKNGGNIGAIPRSAGKVGATPRSVGKAGASPRSGGNIGAKPRSGGNMGARPRSGGKVGAIPKSGNPGDIAGGYPGTGGAGARGISSPNTNPLLTPFVELNMDAESLEDPLLKNGIVLLETFGEGGAIGSREGSGGDTPGPVENKSLSVSDLDGWWG